MPPNISWYQSLATFLSWHEENATKEIYMQVLVLCMSAKKQCDERLAVRWQRVEEQFVA